MVGGVAGRWQITSLFIGLLSRGCYHGAAPEKLEEDLLSAQLPSL